MSSRGTLPFSTLLKLENLLIKPASSREELEHAYRRVYWSYRHRAYIEEHPSRMRLSVFNAFPTTVTFVSIMDKEVIASITVVPDTEVGLPMDEIYRPELDELRAHGRKLVEATMFADRRNRDFRRSIPMLLLMMKYVFDHCCKITNADDICITINPRHEDFYQEYLPFTTLGPQRSYPSVQDHPAIAKRLNLNTVEEACADKEYLQELFLQDHIPAPRLEKQYDLTCKDLYDLFVNLTDAFKDAPPEAIRSLRNHYPKCNWEGWGFA